MNDMHFTNDMQPPLEEEWFAAISLHMAGNKEWVQEEKPGYLQIDSRGSIPSTHRAALPLSRWLREPILKGLMPL